MNKKKVITICEAVMAVFVVSFLCIFIGTKNFNYNKIKGDISGITGTASIFCNNSSLEVGGTTTCVLSGSISSNKVTSVVGTVSASGLSIESVTPNYSIFSNAQAGTNIYYIAGATDITGTFSIATISVKATTAGTATLTFNPRYYGTGEGHLENVTSTPASITVTTPTPEPSSNANLGSLSVTGANIGTFNPNTTSYGADVANSVTSVTINATPAETGATVTGTGTKTLSVGNNSFPLVVTAPSGAQKTYTVSIRRAAASVSSDANLGSLVVKNGSTTVNIGTVSATKQSYSGSVANSVTSVAITATSAHSGAKVTIANNTNNANTYTYSPNLQVGTQTFNIVITAENGTTKKTYTVSITRANSGGGGGGSDAKSGNSTLSSLSVEGASIIPSFASNTYIYSATVKNSVTSTKVTAKAAHSAATVQGTGTVNLKVGKNVVNIIVTAEDGSKSIYNLTIIRQSGSNTNPSSGSGSGNSSSKTDTKKDNNASLKSLKLNDDTIKLGENTLSYNYSVLNKVETLKVDAKAASDKAKVKVEGATKLKVGKNTVMITVTAEDGTQKIYIINVTRKAKEEKLSNNSKLTKLDITNYSFKFDPDVYTYTVKIKDEKQLDINYVSSDSNASVVINGNENLKNGSVVTIYVTAEDGTSTTYTIKIKKSSNFLLILLIVLGALVLLGGIGFLVFFLLKKKKDKKVEEEPVVQETFNQEVYDEYMKNTQIPQVENVPTEEPVSTPVDTPIDTAPTENPVDSNDDIPFENADNTTQNNG